MSRPKNATLQMSVSQRRPKYPKCANCTRFSKPCPHMVEPEEDDPTRADVKIYTGREENGSGWESALAALDSGTKHDWVSGDILKRFRNPNIVSLSSPEIYSAFEGEEYEATKAVWITWHAPKNRFSRKGLFRIVENGPFDVIIGSTVLFEEGIYTFKEAARLFFGRGPEAGEISLMQQTLKQYAVDGRVNQDGSSQQQPKESDSMNQQSNSAANKISRDPQSAPFNPSGSQKRQRPGDEYNASNPHPPPHPQQSVPHTSYAASSLPTGTTSVGTQTDGFSAASASSLARDPPTNAYSPSAPSNNSPSTLALGNGTSHLASDGRQSQRWSCSNCLHRNDPARNPELCEACNAARLSRGRSHVTSSAGGG